MNAPDKPIAAPHGAENTDSDTSDTKPEWKPTSRAFRRAAKKGNTNPRNRVMTEEAARKSGEYFKKW